MNLLSQYLSAFDTILIICAALGGTLVLRHARKLGIIGVQKETIDALKERLSVLEQELGELKADNIQLRHLIETIKDALHARGQILTIDGDLVTIIDAHGTSSSLRRKRAPAKQHLAADPIKEEK